MDYTSMDVGEGMAVYDAEGEKIGHVTEARAGEFAVEKGFFFPKDYWLSYTDIARVEEDSVYLSLSEDQLLEGHREPWHVEHGNRNRIDHEPPQHP